MRRAVVVAIALALAGCKSPEQKLPAAPADARQLLAGPFAGYSVTQLGGGGVEGKTWSQAARLAPTGADDDAHAGMVMLQVATHDLPSKADGNGVPRFGGAPIENAGAVHTVDAQGITLYVGNVSNAPLATAKVAAWFVPYSNAHAIVYAPDEAAATSMARNLLRTWTGAK